MQEAFHFIAVPSCLLFTGAAIYINLVEHPARMSCPTEVAATVFGPSYKRAAPVQVSLALVATAAGALSWLVGESTIWLLGALLIFSVIPFTIIVIMPTNKQLLDPALDHSSANIRALLIKWGKLHAVRSVLSLAASIIFLVATISA